MCRSPRLLAVADFPDHEFAGVPGATPTGDNRSSNSDRARPPRGVRNLRGYQFACGAVRSYVAHCMIHDAIVSEPIPKTKPAMLVRSKPLVVSVNAPIATFNWERALCAGWRFGPIEEGEGRGGGAVAVPDAGAEGRREYPRYVTTMEATMAKKLSRPTAHMAMMSPCSSWRST